MSAHASFINLTAPPRLAVVTPDLVGSFVKLNGRRFGRRHPRCVSLDRRPWAKARGIDPRAARADLLVRLAADAAKFAKLFDLMYGGRCADR